MNFADYLLIKEIEAVFAEIDLLEAEQSLRNRRLQKNLYVDPQTGSSWRALDKWRQLKSIVDYEKKINNTDPKRIWVTFSNTSKFGQRYFIKDSKSTPVGIFAFPVSYVFRYRNSTPFASRPYMHVFKTNKPHFEVGATDYSNTKGFENLKNISPSQVPYADRLKKYADEHGLSFELAVQAAKSPRIDTAAAGEGAVPKTFVSANQFLYRVAEQLAVQMANKSGRRIDRRAAWNKILRDLGISSVADTRDSGHIHDSESTQGVFLDPKDIIHITTIVQRPGSDYNDPANRPTAGDWRTGDNKYKNYKYDQVHNRVADPVNQKAKGITKDFDEYIPDIELMGPLERLHAGIAYRINDIRSNKLNDLFGSPESFDQSVTALLKLSKSFSQLLRQGFDYNKYTKEYATRTYTKEMDDAIKMIDSALSHVPHADPLLLDKVADLRHFHQANKDALVGRFDVKKYRMRTPTYKKRSADEFQAGENPFFSED